MSTHTFRLRDMGGIWLTRDAEVHLDHVHIQFRPSSNIGSSEFILGDSSSLAWRAETMQLMIRTTPGERHVMYAEGNADPVTGTDVKTTQRTATFSSSLSLTPDVEGTEDYWARSYRPGRDLPVLRQFEGDLSEFTVELVWPLLLADTSTAASYVPDYRIYKVYCEFSVRLAS